jgi:histidinol-phosphatase (PHP family)
MILSCLHTHCDFCDGAADIETMCRAAHGRGLASIGFSSHAPLPANPLIPPTSWHMASDRLEAYAAAVRSAAARWAGRLEVYLGLEIDFIAGVGGPADRRWQSLGLDYAIASVHYLVPPNGAPPFTVDGSAAEFAAGVRTGFGGDGEAAAAAYWAALRAMAEAGGFDVVGHLDLVKKHNADGAWFDPAGDSYRTAALAALDAVAAAGLVVEANVGGMNRGFLAEPYPSPELMAACRARGIRMAVYADAHRPEHLGTDNEKKARLSMGSAGYSAAAVFSGRGRWIEDPL